MSQTNDPDLTQITKTFGEAYFVVKETDTVKKDYQKQFFDAATKTLENSPLPQRIVTMPEGTVSYQGDAERWVTTFHPGWRLVKFDGDDAHRMIIEQDPALMKFTFINPIDKRVYARTTVDGGQYLDDERLREQDPDLWLAITRWDIPEWLPDLLYESGVDPDEIDDKLAALCEQKGIARVMLPTDALTSEQLEGLQPYMVPGPVSVKLVPPRDANDEELA